MGPLDRTLHRLAGLRARVAHARGRVRARGQMLVLFVLSIFVLTGITAIVVDVSWYWANTLRVQRAADAAALAGVVWLPGAPGSAFNTARATATQNGYTDGVAGVNIATQQDPANNRRLWVTVTAPVNTFFMKVFGIQQLTAIAPVEGGVRPAGPDGQPRELLRQLRADPRPDLLDDVDPDRPQLVERELRLEGRDGRPDADLDRLERDPDQLGEHQRQHLRADHDGQRRPAVGHVRARLGPGGQPDDHVDRRDRGPPVRRLPVGCLRQQLRSGSPCRGTTARAGRRRPPRPAP